VIAGLLLAAGAGRRYGQPKALVEYDGGLLIEHAVDTLRTGGCSPVVVVLGAEAQEVRERATLTGTTIVDNERWVTGMGSSLRVGLAALDPTPATAVVVLLVDTPGITPGAVARLVASAGQEALASATYQGRRGHPVLLGRAHWRAVAAQATGDEGARRYLVAHHAVRVPCDDVADPTDLDRPPSRP
jgi:CTP:molybdopterin cytidylyltransferase MocA